MAIQGRKSADDVLRMALACGSTVESAAQKAGISVRTAYRRLKDAAFRESLHSTRADMVERAAGMLTAATLEAIKTLLMLVQDASTPPSVRLGAARAVVELGSKLREQAQLEGRVAELEKWIVVRTRKSNSR